jgi:hypothetical protein
MLERLFRRMGLVVPREFEKPDRNGCGLAQPEGTIELKLSPPVQWSFSPRREERRGEL